MAQYTLVTVAVVDCPIVVLWFDTARLALAADLLNLTVRQFID